MPPRTKEKFCANKRRTIVARLYLQGFNQCEIAERTKVSQFTISKDIAIVHKRWIAEAITERGIYVHRELEKISIVEAEAWGAFEKSKKKARRVTKEKGLGAGGMVDKTTTMTEDQTGDARFLVIILNCIKQRCAILGLEQEPSKNGIDPEEIIKRMAPILAEEFKLIPELPRDAVVRLLDKLNALFGVNNNAPIVGSVAMPVAMIEPPDDEVLEAEIEGEGK
jgi:hypothetical protein